ncbi:hypothetical protein PO878_15425 [Iamia majanohamensis]|uniref:Uncharacterized protein n=1 Tax=Iamia majanohamensis TaxID=467976 RepID=A0AAE9Y7K8_9ACTN|nr:hypothetical protein [Iamia majanohamensis]WCO65893.1 hypothetical protein PO878_15425 [Iamia majanohamensis]
MTEVEDGLGTAAPPGWRGPLLLAAPGIAWWMANVGFWTLGVLDTDELGHRAWRAGFYGFPRWSQTAFATLGVPAWLLAVLVAGAVLAVRGRAAWRPIVLVGVGATLAAPLLVVLGTWAYPGGA